MTQEAMPPRDPVQEWFETYGNDDAWQRRFEAMQRDHSYNDPWVNGHYAIACIAWGLMVMFIISVVGVGL